jgi:hypothetical protein
MMMDQQIERWEDSYGLAPRLSHFFSSPEARTLLRDFSSCADAKGDVEVLAFLLIFYVWPEQDGIKLPSHQTLKDTARSLEDCSRRLRELVETRLLDSPEQVKETSDRLHHWATQLRAQTSGVPAVTIGPNTWIAENPPTAKRHRAKRRVVFFLTYYFHTLGCRTPPWQVITRFLILAKLLPSTATDKQLATWWSNVIQRHHRGAGAGALRPFQQDQLILFEHFKKEVWSARETSGFKRNQSTAN